MNTLRRIERKLGFQSLADFNDITDALDYAAAQGFRALELNLGNPFYLNQLRSKTQQARIRTRSRKLKIPLLVHSVDGLNYFLSDWKHVRMNLSFMKRIIDCAAHAGAVHYTFHLGMDMRYSFMNAERKYTWELYPEPFERNLRRVLVDLREYARRLDGMTLGVENVGGFRFAWVFPILDELLGGRLCLTMDIGHINVYKGKVLEAENGFFFDHPRLVKSAHIHDNDGKLDQHSIIGEGTIDFLPYFKLLGAQNAYCIFEVRPKEAAVECLKRFREKIAPRL
jgi:sugar phosphate isomerase/epimerase